MRWSWAGLVEDCIDGEGGEGGEGEDDVVGHLWLKSIESSSSKSEQLKPSEPKSLQSSRV